jgi:RNA recognition motif-containing protein
VNIYVGNLSYQATEDDIRALFAQHGEVQKVTIIKDKISGESRGFCFVEMANGDEGRTAIAELNGVNCKGRALKINEANPRPERPAGGGGGRSGGPRRDRDGGGGGFRGRH